MDTGILSWPLPCLALCLALLALPGWGVRTCTEQYRATGHTTLSFREGWLVCAYSTIKVKVRGLEVV